MKKLSIVLAVALAFAVAVPALAAPAISVGGSLESKYTADKNGLNGENWFDLNLGLNAGDKVKASVVISPWDNPGTPAPKTSFDPTAANGNSYTGAKMSEIGNGIGSTYTIGGGSFVPTGSDTAITVPALKIKKAVLEADGSLWNGGQPVHTAIGDIAVNESGIVGDLQNRKGIEISGMKVGPLGIEAFYSEPGGNSRVMNHDDENKYDQVKVVNSDNVYGANLTANVAGIELGANVVRSDGNGAKTWQSPEFALTGKVSPIQNVTFDGYFAEDRNENSAYRVNGSMNVLPSLRVFGGYRDTAAGFAPNYMARLDSDKSGVVEADEYFDASNVLVPADQKGFNAGVETTQAGVHMVGTYDDPTQEAKVAADTTLVGFKLDGSVKAVDSKFDTAEVNASRDFQVGSMKITGTYGLDIERVSGENQLTHEVKAATTLDVIPALKGISLDGRVKVAPSHSDNEYEANAKYTAPNGMNLGVQYIKDADHTNGDVIGTAGMKVQF